MGHVDLRVSETSEVRLCCRPLGADLTMDALLNRRYSSGQAPELLIENLLGILLAGGLDPQEAAWACDIFVLLLMTGVVGAG